MRNECSFRGGNVLADSRKEEMADKKTVILKTTLELISEQGFVGTPMSQIAQRADIGMGTIYRYFKNKDDLLNALYINIKQKIADCSRRSYPENLPAREAFKHILGNLIRYFKENPAELSFMEQYVNSPVITAATREEAMRMAEPFEDLYRRAKEQNLLKEMPFEISCALLGGAAISLAKLYLASPDGLSEESLAMGLDALWDMIALK